MLNCIDRRPGSCLFIDEADALLSEASDAAACNHPSEMLGEFRQLSRGVKTAEKMDGQTPTIVMATNISLLPLGFTMFTVTLHILQMNCSK